MTCGKCGNCKGICPVTFGLALGIVSGLCMMFLAYSAMWWGVGAHMVEEYGTVYAGYESTYVGGLIGFLWGLLDGFIFGFLLILFYHLLSCCRRMCCKKNGDNSCGCGPSDRR